MRRISLVAAHAVHSGGHVQAQSLQQHTLLHCSSQETPKPTWSNGCGTSASSLPHAVHSGGDVQAHSVRHLVCTGHLSIAPAHEGSGTEPLMQGWCAGVHELLRADAGFPTPIIQVLL